MVIFRNLLAALVLLALAAAPASAQFTDQRTWAGTSGGAANAQTLTVANMPTYVVGVPLRFLAGFSNTTALTINVNSIGIKNVLKPTAAGAVALTGGEVIAGQLVEVVYDGTQFQLTANNVQSAAIRTQPQGYLTPCQVSSGSPVTGCTAGQLVPTADVTSATNLYYEPTVGNQIPIYNGSNMNMTGFTELSLAIPSSRLANTLYDVCVFLNSGTPTAVFGPAWTTSTAGSSARGTGAGTAQIVQVQGIWTNAVTISGVNGASTFSIPANQCTVVGTVYIDGTAGQVTFHRTYGQSRKWAVWNFYNRLPITLQMGDPTANWSYNSTTIRQSNGSAANTTALLTGLPEELASILFVQVATITNAGGATIGIGINSTTVMTGKRGISTVSPGSTAVNNDLVSRYIMPPSLGLNNINSLEAGNASGPSTFQGANIDMLFTIGWRG